ncbi:hypothetical protein [Bifidobacterium tissieri]|uniref:Uncharacterized protein n=1 Tax=Bifidobacterium tissieri TaxID=1630162 RepID=A0A5M9ZVS2_9BIFI|nr:hypothetical protein [Bifidobacterium tissieri]KAA8828672.1 hypothetical protein EM849_11585 [Bifidobacterium tissieri]KAA8831615.1 hypothetical protein EMO89_02500 [Bifidobacterium tissieri]
MRIRTIRPEFYESEHIGSLTWDARYVFECLWSYVQDNGVNLANPKLIRGTCMPYDSDRCLKRIERALDQLETIGSIIRYEHQGKKLLWIPNFTEYQKIKNPGVCRFPTPIELGIIPEPHSHDENVENTTILDDATDVEDDSTLLEVESTDTLVDPTDTTVDPTDNEVDPTDTMGTGVGVGVGVIKKENTSCFPKKKRKTRIRPTFTPDQRSIDHARALHLDPQRERDKFINHWQATGGKADDWQAMYRGWCDNSPDARPSKPSTPQPPSEAWISRNLIERIPPEHAFDARRQFMTLISQGTPKEQAAQTIINENGATP